VATSAPAGIPGPESRAPLIESTDRPPRLDERPILVAVDGRESSVRALEWAASEAAARECALRIVNVFSWRAGMDSYGLVPIVDTAARTNAEIIVAQAADRAREVEPTLDITGQVREGSVSTGVLQAVDADALIGLGRPTRGNCLSSYVGSSIWPIVRHAAVPVSVITLPNEPSTGPGAGRIVAYVGPSDQSAVLSVAFRAALRRGIGVTVLDRVGSAGESRRRVSTGRRMTSELRAAEATLGGFRAAFPEVDVRLRLVAAPGAGPIVAESVGAALIVLGCGSSHRPPCARSVTHDVVRLAGSPVTIVKVR
jgi:nucleotide-binding universal stress UspA family protein